MSISPKLIITFIRLEENNPFDSFIVLGQQYKIEKLITELDIPIHESIFALNKEKKMIDFQLLSLTETYTYRFNIYYGVNRAYLFLLEYTEMLCEICFKEQQRLECKNFFLDKTDFFDDDSRRRMILINAPIKIKIEGCEDIIYEYISKTLRKQKENSYQISVFDSSNSYAVAKIIKKEMDFSVISDIKNYKASLEDFQKELNKLIENKIENIEEYKKLILKNENIKIIDINFVQKISKLQEEFKNDDDYNLMYLYFLWYILYICYIQNNMFPIQINIMVEYLNKFYFTYLKDKSLSAYQKVLLFYSNCVYFVYIHDIKSYESKKLNYVKCKDIKPNSVYGLSFKFINEFIEKLNSKSLLFYPLLLLNNGIYYYKEETIYGFDMQTCNNLKNHLKDLIPEVFFEIEDDNDNKSLNYDNGFNFKGFGIVFLNKKSLLKEYKNDPTSYEFSGKVEERKIKSYAVKVAKTWIHELFAHNKYIFSYLKNIDSPLRFFCNKNNLVSFVSPSSPIYNDKLFLKGNKSNKGESGKFLEFFFGQFRNRLVLDLLLELDDVSKLYDSIDYFVKEDLEEIKKYIIIKYSLKEKNIDYKDNINLNLEEENKNLQLYDVKYKIGYEELKNDEHNFFKNTKSADNLAEILFEYHKKEESRGYDYYMEKAKQEKDPVKKASFLFELLNYLKT